MSSEEQRKPTPARSCNATTYPEQDVLPDGDHDGKRTLRRIRRVSGDGRRQTDGSRSRIQPYLNLTLNTPLIMVQGTYLLNEEKAKFNGVSCDILSSADQRGLGYMRTVSHR